MPVIFKHCAVNAGKKSGTSSGEKVHFKVYLILVAEEESTAIYLLSKHILISLY